MSVPFCVLAITTSFIIVFVFVGTGAPIYYIFHVNSLFPFLRVLLFLFPFRLQLLIYFLFLFVSMFLVLFVHFLLCFSFCFRFNCVFCFNFCFRFCFSYNFISPFEFCFCFNFIKFVIYIFLFLFLISAALSVSVPFFALHLFDSLFKIKRTLSLIICYNVFLNLSC